ncbi:hypothetical protein V2J09_001701 [Rumex salicifolius]
MAKPHISSLSLITLLLLPFATTTTAQPPLESFIYGGCSPISYAPNSAFSSNLNSLLTFLTNSAASSPYNHFTQNGVVQGLYQCEGDLPQFPDCSSCVSHAVSQLRATCPSSSGAAVQLQGCYVRYDASPFLGVEDKSVVLKKCGPSVGLEREKTVGPARDKVLTGLVDDDGSPYRSGGVAQCMGDLSVDQCTDCVDQAVKLLRSECGTASFGNVFLGKCYVRFSVSGSSDSGYNGGKISIGSVKTFAIIAGLLAAIVENEKKNIYGAAN